MIAEIGQKYLVTTDCWFTAPDGHQYKAVWGTVTALNNSQETLGIKVNARSQDWFMTVGNMVIAGCQIHYVIKADTCDFRPKEVEIEHQGKNNIEMGFKSRIYNADNP